MRASAAADAVSRDVDDDDDELDWGPLKRITHDIQHANATNVPVQKEVLNGQSRNGATTDVVPQVSWRNVYLFLDVDGVLHPDDASKAPSRDSVLRVPQLTCFRAIVEEIYRRTGTRKNSIGATVGKIFLVLSSTWREHPPRTQRLLRELRKWGLQLLAQEEDSQNDGSATSFVIPVVVSSTPVLSDFFASIEQRREREIRAWIRKFATDFEVLENENDRPALDDQENSVFLVLDDLALTEAGFGPRQNTFLHVDRTTGLVTEKDVARAVDLMEKQVPLGLGPGRAGTIEKQDLMGG
ncbi:unnamed protein product [Amoebophrya sp. A25]|nr:unnamed protein product [Amoebophrya sp. A25]|eukprot:GSA25T00000594001.1